MAAAAGAAGAQLVVAGDLGCASGGDRHLDPVHLGVRQRFVDEHAGGAPEDPESRRQTIATATTSAVIGSKAALPVTWTRARPKSTPAEVIASVRRCAASPSSACDSCAFAWRERTEETPRLATTEKAITAMPTPSRSTLGADDQLVGRLVDDHPGADQDQHPLDRRRQVFDLLVAVGVLGVGRLVGFADREEGDDRGDQVDQRVDRLGDDRDRAGDRPGGELERDQDRVGGDRERRRPALGADHGAPAVARPRWSASLRTARPRWLIAFFSAALSSA